MKQIRKSIFETNSSSTHTLTICTEDEYKAFQKGDLFLHQYDTLISKKEVEKAKQLDKYFDEDEYQTFEQFEDEKEYEIYQNAYTTSKGEKIVVFGKYGGY